MEFLHSVVRAPIADLWHSQEWLCHFVAQALLPVPFGSSKNLETRGGGLRPPLGRGTPWRARTAIGDRRYNASGEVFTPTLKGSATFRREGEAHANASSLRAVSQNLEFPPQSVHQAPIDCPSQGAVFGGVRKKQAGVGN